jgi:hypothetical protein
MMMETKASLHKRRRSKGDVGERSLVLNSNLSSNFEIVLYNTRPYASQEQWWWMYCRRRGFAVRKHGL